jgi:transposase-like protein
MTGYVTKPGVDWGAINAEYVGGVSSRELAKRHGVSHTAINKHAKREGWNRPVSTETPAGVAKVIAATLLPVSESPLANSPICNDDLRATILTKLADGATYNLAAATVGINERTLRDWREKDTAFAGACRQSISAFALKQLGHIEKAGARDWRAAAHLLERHPETRQDFAAPARTGEGNKIEVVFNMPERKAVTISQDGTRATIDAEVSDA